MKTGDLVQPLIACGGLPGSTRCGSAIVINKAHSHNETVEVDMFVYKEVEVYEYELVCPCGPFEEYEKHLEMIS